MVIDAILWRRLDSPGHDACRLEETGEGWCLDGTAVFVHEGVPARVAYHLACDGAWRTREGEIRGWLGADRIDFRVQRPNGGEWVLNGAAMPQVAECVDLDLGFTPASNLFQIRRIALAVGESADVNVAWLNLATGVFEVLRQRYERRTVEMYWYDAPQFSYAAMLDVRPSGFVRRYPGLWKAERVGG